MRRREPGIDPWLCNCCISSGDRPICNSWDAMHEMQIGLTPNEMQQLQRDGPTPVSPCLPVLARRFDLQSISSSRHKIHGIGMR